MDGFDVFDWIEKKQLQTRIILLTGRPEHEKLSSYIPRAQAFIYKPFSITEIENALAVAFANGRTDAGK